MCTDKTVEILYFSYAVSMACRQVINFSLSLHS